MKTRTDEPRSYESPIIPENIKDLANIGTKIDDFEPIPSNGKSYCVLGKGNFGFAEKVKSKLNNKIYAIKKLSVKDVKAKDFIRETTSMTQFNHKYIMKLYGYFQAYESINKLKEIYLNDKKERFKNETNDVNMYNLVMDCMPNGSLETLCKKYRNENKMIEEDFIIKIFEQLLEALKYLESKGLMHRDIKLDNILLDENLNAKISDFGISALYPQANNPNNQGDFIFSKFTTVGRRDFVAPEIFSHDYDFRVDIYGLGLTMLCLMSKMNPISIDENGKRNINTELMYEGYNKYLRSLVLTMILKKELRPDAKEALNELNFIAINIKNPDNDEAAKSLDHKIQKILELSKQQEIQNINQPNMNIPNQISNIQFPFNNNQPQIQRSVSNQIPSQMPISAMNPVQNMSSSADDIKNMCQAVKPLICTLKCLYFCLKDNLNFFANVLMNCNMNNSVSFDILNAIKFVEKDYDISYLYSCVITFKNNLAKKANLLSSNYLRPNEIYESLINYLKEETRNVNFNINNINFIPNLNLNLNNFPHVTNNINMFLNEKKNPFVNSFYYLTIDISRCLTCSNLLKVDVFQNNEIPILGSLQGNISNLIYSSLKIPSNEFYTCNNCGVNNTSKRDIFLLTLPQFLVVSCINKEMAMKNVDFNINLKNFLYPGMPLNSFYDLFAFIYKENYEYCTVIYQYDGWYFFNNQKLTKINVAKVNDIYVYFVIYKLRN